MKKSHLYFIMFQNVLLPFRYYVLDITDNIEDLGGIKWDLFGTFLLAWIITFCCVFKGMLVV